MTLRFGVREHAGYFREVLAGIPRNLAEWQPSAGLGTQPNVSVTAMPVEGLQPGLASSSAHGKRFEDLHPREAEGGAEPSFKSVDLHICG